MPPTLTILGASVRAAAQSALRGGYSPVAGDLFGDADLVRICPATRVGHYPSGLAEVCFGSQPGEWLYTGALENYPDLIDAMAARRPLLGNGGSCLRQVRSVEILSRVLREEGFQMPEFTSNPGEIPQSETWLRKARRSASGALLAYWDPRQNDRPPSDDWYYQRFVPGNSYGV